jgi:hypothetical protein
MPEVGMEGHFDEKLRLIRDDGGAVVGVTASGPVGSWESDETSATVEVTVSKNGVTVHGSTDVRKPAEKWTVALPTEGQAGLEPGGGATGVGHALFRASGKEPRVVNWTQEKIELV